MERIPNKPLKFILYYARMYKFILFFLAIAIIVRSVTISNFTPYVMKLIVDNINTFSGSELLKNTIPLVILYFFVYFLWFLCNLFMPILDSLSIAKMESKMREDLFEYTSGQSYTYFNNNFSGNLLTKINNIVYRSSAAWFKSINLVISNLLSMGLFISFFFKASHLLAVIMTVWILVIFLLGSPYSNKMKKASKELSVAKSKFTGVLVDILSNIFAVKSYCRENFEEAKIEKESNNIFNYFKKNASVKMSSRIVFSFISLIFLALILFVSIYLKVNNSITIGDFVFIVTAAIRSFFFINDIISGFLSVIEDIGSVVDGLDKIMIPYTINDHENAKKLKISNGEIAIKNLDFSFMTKRV